MEWDCIFSPWIKFHSRISRINKQRFETKETMAPCNYPGNDIVPLESTLPSFSEISYKLHETRELKGKQNEQYGSSLEKDRKKIEQREATQKRMEYLDNLNVYRQSKLKTEPFITKDSMLVVLVSVLHNSLGKKQAIFFIETKIEAKFITGYVVYQQKQNSFINITNDQAL